jgi:plastocyanin
MLSSFQTNKHARYAVMAILTLIFTAFALEATADRRRRRGRGGDDGGRGGARVARGGSAAAAGGLVAIDNAGKLVGKVSLTGTAPAEIQLNQVMAGTPACADSHDEPVFTRRVVANDNNELRDVFVWVKEGLPEGQNFGRKSEEVVLDQVACMYDPPVFAFQTGQKFIIKNSDALLHNVHAIGDDGNGKDYFNLAMPTKDMTLDKTGEFRSEDIVVKFKCEVHPWMFAYAGVVSHPYFAVTSEDGSFEIPNLPPGKYTIGCWQRKAGMKEMEVEVPANGEAEANFVYEFSADK